jgi:hypothetical protein
MVPTQQFKNIQQIGRTDFVFKAVINGDYTGEELMKIFGLHNLDSKNRLCY